MGGLKMSDNYREIDSDGAYRSRRTTQSTSSRAAQRRTDASPQQPAAGAAPRSSSSRPAAGGNGQYIGGHSRGSEPASRRSQDGEYIGRSHTSQNGYTGQGGSASSRPAARPASSTAQRPASVPSSSAAVKRPPTPSNGTHAGFTVNISDEDYYDSDASMRELSAARRTTPPARRSAAASERALIPAETNATTAKRIVTGSLGDTYRIEDDGVIAPRQIRSKQKLVRKKNRGCIVALVYAAAVCSISILLAYYIIVGVNDMFALRKDSTDLTIDVPKGATIDDVTKLLDDNDIIEYPFFFKTYAKISKKNTGFKAGTFTLNSKSDYNQILTKLRRPAGADKSTITVTIPEGLTVEQVAVIMEDNSVCDAESFMKTAKDVEMTQKSLQDINGITDRLYKAEGYLYPDTYNFYLSEGSVNAVNRLLKEFDRHWTSEYADKAKERGMTMDQVIILASVVEREASKTEDRYNVASVFANRLKNSKGTGGKLQSDATRWYPYATKKELLASDKLTQAQKDDWINNNTGICDTYRIKGLPPMPICTPSLDSINAVLEHDNTSYYYFCSDAQGKFYFAKTLNEHNANLKKAGLA